MKNVIKTVPTKVKALVTAVAVSVMSLPTQAFAATPGDTTGASNIVGNAIRLMVQIGGGLAGAVFIIIGLVKMLTAYHNGQPQEMHAAIKDLVVGAAFVGLALIVGPAMGALGL